jgi:hypothetical protein
MAASGNLRERNGPGVGRVAPGQLDGAKEGKEVMIWVFVFVVLLAAALLAFAAVYLYVRVVLPRFWKWLFAERAERMVKDLVREVLEDSGKYDEYLTPDAVSSLLEIVRSPNMEAKKLMLAFLLGCHVVMEAKK